MLKKLVISLLLAVAIACGVGFGITTAMAAEDNTSSVEVSESADLKLATASLVELFPNGYGANTSITIKDGEEEIGTLTIDLASTTSGFSGGGKKMAKNSIFTFVPNEGCSVRKFYCANQATNASFTIDAKYGTSSYASNDEEIKKILKEANISDSYSYGVIFNSEYVPTEQEPYKFKLGINADFCTICIVYERGSYTKTYDCTNDKKASPATVKVGDATFFIKYEGMFNNGYPAYGDGSFKITINPVPGYVINYVIFTSPLDNPFEASELKFPGLEATYENGNLKVTGMQPGQTYELYSDGGAKGLLTSITVNYIEHEHTGIYEPGSDETHHFKQCECLWRVDEEEHVFGEGEITLEPTHQRKGKAKYTCTNAECGYEKEEQVAPNFADTEVSLDKELRYNGSIQFAVYTVKYKGNEVGMSNYKVVSGVARGKEPGDYTFTIGPKDGSIFEGTKEFTFTIKKALVEKPALDTKEFYFNNTVKTYTVENSEFYTVLDNSNQQTNPGSYKVRIALNNPEFSEWEDGTTDVLEYDFVINKGNYDMSAVVFEDKTVTYNGSAFSIEATNLPDGVTVSYENNGKTDAGEYDIIAKFTGDAVNYNLIADKTAKLIINKSNAQKPTADSTVFTYNGQEQTYALATSDLYTISSTKATNAGSYTITVALKDKTNYQWNDQTVTDLTYSFVINKATYDMSAVVFENKNVIYNGSTFSLEATNLPDGVTVSYENNGKTVAGEYTVTAKFVGNDNYNLIADKTAKLIINKANVVKPTADSTVFTYNGQEQTYALATSDLYTISSTKATNAGSYTITVALKDKTNYQWNDQTATDLTYSFVIGKATYDMSAVVFADKTVTYNGSTFSLEATNLPDGVTVSYENNDKVSAGEYIVTAKFVGNDNYNVIADKTATLTINKATYDMSAVVFENKTVTYNGSTFSLEATNLPNGVTVTYENNGKTVVGEYAVTAKFTGDVDNYNLIADKTATLTIIKANVVKPTADSTVFIYNGQEQTYALATSDLYTISSTKATNAGSYTITVALKDKDNYQWNDQTTNDLTYSFVIGKATYDMRAVVFENKTVTYNGNEFNIEATNLPNGVTVTYENNGKTVVGEYTVTAKFTGDADNYNLIADKTATLVINKATYNMGAVVFENKTVVYDGSTVFSIEATNLPNGVSVTYEGNGKIEAGVYTITAKFTGDADNYNLIADRTATLVIRNATLDFNTGAESNGASNIIISAPEGIDPTKELVVDVIENTEDYQEFVDKNQRVALVYDIKLIQDNVSVQPDGKLQFRILIPEQLRGREFSIVHIHDGNETVIVDYQIDGDYVVFESDKLSEFVFVYDMGSLVWLIILLSVIATLETLFLVYLSKKKNNGKKLASVYPPFVFGMFLSKGQLALVIILAVAVVALTVVSILWAIKVFGKKKNAEEIASTEQTEEKVNDRSFSARLSQCSPEVIEYYNDIKNELLSYSKVKAKTSLRHETFRVGMPTVAKLTIRGKSLYLFLALDPNDYKESKYKIKDMSNVNANKDVPTMYKINLPRRAVYAKELIADLMKKFDAEKTAKQ